MKLYHGGRAPNPRRVAIFLAEKGIEVEIVPVDMSKLEHRDAKIASINPFKKLPVLELDDGRVISETVAICRYFEEIQPEPALMGTDAADRAIVEMWQRRVELYYFGAVASAFRHTHPAMEGWEVPQLKEWGELNRPKARVFMEFLDAELASRNFIAGERYTIADITTLVAFDFMKPAKIPVPHDLQNLMRWYGEVSSRESAKVQ